METRAVTSDTAGQYPKLHVFVVFVGVLSVLLALDVVYASLLVHSYTARQLAAHRERRADRRLKRAIAVAVASAANRASAPVNSAVSDSSSPAMDSDMQRAA